MSLSLRLSHLEKRLNPPEPAVRNLEQVPCGLCGRQFSKYTCPTCNMPYCSLNCFRSEAHSQCTEPFYRQALEDEIKSGPSRTAEEKKAMMDMLKRFEEQSLEEDEAADGDSDEEGEDLENTLQGLDLDSASTEALWNVLTPAQRKEFTRILDDPDGEAARALLSSELVKEHIVLPWWEESFDDDDEGSTEDGARTTEYGRVPEMLEIPPALLSRPFGGPVLVYNMLAIGLAYSYVTRHMGVSPLTAVGPGDDSQETLESSRVEIVRLLPFLADRKSTVVFSTADEAIRDIWSRLDPDTVSSSLLVLLLRDSSRLLEPSPISELPTTSTPQDAPLLPAPDTSVVGASRFPLLMLSDLHTLMQPNRAVTLKLQFYAAHVARLPVELLGTVSREAELAGEELEQRPAALEPVGGNSGQSPSLRLR